MAKMAQKEVLTFVWDGDGFEVQDFQRDRLTKVRPELQLTLEDGVVVGIKAYRIPTDCIERAGSLADWADLTVVLNAMDAVVTAHS